MDNASDNKSEAPTFKSLSSRSDIYDQVERIYFIDFIQATKTEEPEKYSETTASTSTEIVKQTDIVDYEIKQLNNSCSRPQIKSRIKQLQLQYEIITRRISDNILQNSQAYSNELQRVSDFKLLLEDSYQICSIARRSLFMNETVFTKPTLQLIKKQVQKTRLISLYKSIQGIKRLKRTNVKIRSLIEAGDYQSAINHCFECEKSLAVYEHFKCIKDLKKQIKDHFYQIEQLLDASITQVCLEYNEVSYEMIATSVKLLNKREFIDQLNTHIISALNMTAAQTIMNMILIQQATSYKREDLKCREYSELCGLLSNNNYRGCLVELCNNLWNIMKNYYRMFMWHEKAGLLDQETKQKFNQGLSRLWQDVQLKISICFRSMCFEHLKFDEFIEILTVNNRLIEIGQEYCNRSCDSQIMLKATKEQTLAFFKSYHMSHLEELKMFLENEIWHLCPVKPSFSIFKLHEYRFLRAKNKFSANSSVLNNFLNNDVASRTPVKKTTEPALDLNHNIIDMLSDMAPFDTHTARHSNKQLINNNNNNNEHCDQTTESGFSSDDDSDDSDSDDNSDKENISMNIEDLLSPRKENSSATPSKKSLISILIARSKHSHHFKTPMITNTTLNIMRLYGKYIQMLSIFRIISTDVIAYLMQLFYFYFYYIYMHFAKEASASQSSLNYTEIEVIIKNIRTDLFVQSKYNMAEPVIATIKSMKNRQDYLSCISERIVAAESLVFLAHQLENIFPLLSEYLPNGSGKNLSVYLNILRETPKMRQPIYLHISKVAIDYQQIGDSISRVNWDIEELMSQHNAYIDLLLRQVEQFIFDINSLKEQLVVERRILNIFLEQICRNIMLMLVDGYGSIKKCSNEGRALMQLDFQQLVVKLEKICDLRPLPDKDYVEFYIKAYYLPDSSLEKWVRDHSEYSQRNVISLINLMAQATKKTKLSIVASFES